MPASRSAVVVVSNTALVEDALQKADDFMTARALAAATGLNSHAINSALWWLQKARAAEAVTDAAGVLHWMLTPETDQRSKTMREHRKEDEPRKTAAHKKV